MNKYLVIFSEYNDLGESWPTVCYTDDLESVVDDFLFSLDNIEESLRDQYPDECEKILDSEDDEEEGSADYIDDNSADEEPDDEEDEDDEENDDEYDDDMGYDEADIVRAFRDLKSAVAPTAEFFRDAAFDEGGFGIRVDVFAEGEEIVPTLLDWIEWCEDELDEELINAVKENPRDEGAVGALVDAVNEYLIHRNI